MMHPHRIPSNLMNMNQFPQPNQQRLVQSPNQFNNVQSYTSPYRNDQRQVMHSPDIHAVNDSKARALEETLKKEREANATLQNKIKMLEKDKTNTEELEKQMKILIQENDQLHSYIEKEKVEKEKNVKLIEEQLNLLVNENYKLNGIIEDLQAKVQVLIEENDKLTDALEQQNTENSQFVTSLESQIAKVTEELNAAKSNTVDSHQLEAIKAEKDQYWGEFQRLQSVVNILTEEQREQESAQVVLEKQISVMTIEYEEMRKSLQLIDQTKKEFESEMNNLTRHNEQLRTYIENKQVEAQKQANVLSSTQMELNLKVQQVQQLQIYLEEANRNNSILETSVMSSNEEARANVELNARVACLQNTVQKQVALLEEKEQQVVVVEQMTRDIELLQTQLNEYQVELLKKDEELAAVVASLSVQKEEVIETVVVEQANNIIVNQEIENQLKLLTQSLEVMNVCKASLETQKEQLNTMLESRNNDLFQCRRRVEELESTIVILESKVKESENKEIGHEEVRVKLETELNQVRLNVEHLETQFANQKTENSKLYSLIKVRQDQYQSVIPKMDELRTELTRVSKLNVNTSTDYQNIKNRMTILETQLEFVMKEQNSYESAFQNLVSDTQIDMSEKNKENFILSSPTKGQKPAVTAFRILSENQAQEAFV